MRYLILIALLFLPNAACAATLTLTASPPYVGVGDLVRVTVAIESDVSVNAFSGALRYPSAMEPVAQEDGNSIISLWIERPTVEGGAVRFAGIVPGGYSGTEGKLFAATFRATSAGQAAFALDDIEVLANDGAGTPEAAAHEPLTLAVAPEPVASAAELEDHMPPESFLPLLGRDPGLFDGRDYAAFIAADKGSGVHYYEVAETRLPYFIARLSWKRAESPYILLDQAGTSDLYVKAVDRAGNAQVEVVSRRHLFRPYEWAMFALALVGSLLFVRFKLFP